MDDDFSQITLVISLFKILFHEAVLFTAMGHLMFLGPDSIRYANIQRRKYSNTILSLVLKKKKKEKLLNSWKLYWTKRPVNRLDPPAISVHDDIDASI